MATKKQDRPVAFQGNQIGRMVPDGWYTRAQAAELVGRDADTLKRWHRNGLYKASGAMKAGRLTVHLYSQVDIETMKQIAKTQKPGRKTASDQDVKGR